jgi:micrococcal nuclease
MRKYYHFILLLPILLACAMPLTLASPTPSVTSCLPQNTRREVGEVINVIDGDTIDVRIDGIDYRVRYIGMDTPEIDEPFYGQTTKLNNDLVGGRQVTLIKDVSETDRFERLLRYILVDGMLINYELVRQGYARAVTFPPDVACAETLMEAEQLARLEGIGLWGELP